MNVDILMPKMGESITESRIIRWLKQPGDIVEQDEPLLEIATDKVDTDVPSPTKGVLVQILVNENETVDVGTAIGRIETDAAQAVVVTGAHAAAHAAPVTSDDAPHPAQSTVATFPETRGFSVDGSGTRKFFSPVVQRLAAEHGITLAELATLDGSGAGGRITKQDVLRHLEARSTHPATDGTAGAPATPRIAFAGGNDATIPMDNLQRVMAEHMVRSKATSPHVTVVSEVDVTTIARYRYAQGDAFKAREGFALTYLPFVAEAAVRALAEFPLMNASVEGTNIVVHKSVGLGIAVAMEGGGLIAPVVKGAESLNRTGLARAVADVAGRARRKKLLPDDIQGGTFTITNFGVFGNLFGTPIINQPQVAILGMGAVKKRPVVIESEAGDAVAVRSMMYLSLSFDHRIIDGALGGRFLERVVALLEAVDPAAA